MSDASPLPFAEWLAALRLELADAERDRDASHRLRIDKIELDLEITSSREAGAKGKIKFWLADASVDGKLKFGRAQRMKLALTPLDAAGRALEVNDELDQYPE